MIKLWSKSRLGVCFWFFGWVLCQSVLFAEEPRPSSKRWLQQAVKVLPTTTDSADRDTFQLPPGFQIEELFVVPQETHGSWVSLALDTQGRLIACDQGDRGLSRILVPPIGSGEPTRVERLKVPITSAQGMVYAFDQLYVVINNSGIGSGLYRVCDTDGDDQFDEVTQLKPLDGGGEHGPHAVRLGPDGQSLYVIGGNHTDPPKGFQASRLLSNWQEDLLLPRQWDANGHATGRLAPGGWVAKTDPAGRVWEIINIGYRNAYDFGFGPEGELFVYDADMEWDFGMPWYRPTRLVHAVSGGDFGWRSGTGKWPTYYVDSLPAVVDIGPGSPTGVTYGQGLKFPTRYQRAMYLLDWTFGTMYAVHFTPDGASYGGRKEEFVARRALPLTDAVVGPDGALYFTVGGRGTQSALYRVTYVGDEPTTVPVDDPRLAELRQLRRKLESFHPTAVSPSTKIDLSLVLQSLGHTDRHIRYAARVALEATPLEQYRDQIQASASDQRRIQLAVALARASGQFLTDDSSAAVGLRDEVLAALGEIEFGRLSVNDQRDLLRAYAVVFSRLGRPSTNQAVSIIETLDPYFPGEFDTVNHELARVLVFLNAPSIVQKCLAMMDRQYAPLAKQVEPLLGRNPGYGETIEKVLTNHPELHKLHYAFILRNMRYGWTLEERKKYFAWLDAAKQKSGGHSYEGFLDKVRQDAVENLSAAERLALETNAPAAPVAEELPQPVGPGQSWTHTEVVTQASDLRKRSFENGKRTFAAGRCVICHRFDGAGGSTGPDLTSVGGRFNLQDLTDSIIHPSKVVSDQYRASIIETIDGRVVTGRIVAEDEQAVTVQVNPEDATEVARIPKSEIESLEPSGKSLMPEKLLDTLNESEVLDLLAYLLSRGNPQDLMFQ